VKVVINQRLYDNVRARGTYSLSVSRITIPSREDYEDSRSQYLSRSPELVSIPLVACLEHHDDQPTTIEFEKVCRGSVDACATIVLDFTVRY